MELYHSEDQQLEAIKRWWKENSVSVIAGVAIGVALIAGYNAWRERQQHVVEQAAGLYQQMVKAMEAKQTESADKLSERIIHDYDSTNYGAFARLAQAKIKAEAGDMPAVRRILEGVLASSADDKVKHLARLRLGQALLDANDAQGALNVVEEQAKGKGFGAFERDYQLLKGDSYMALGRRDEARTAYQEAQRLGAASAFLEMKLGELGGGAEQPHP